MRGLARRASRRPTARRRSSCPSPASTTSTTRWPRSPPRCAWGSALESAARGALDGARPCSAASRRSRSASTPVSILLIKNPAGANEVLRTLLLEARATAPALDLWIALNDRIADGRDVSWIWDADFELLAGERPADRLRRARARRRWPCGSSTPGIDPASIAVEESIERSLDRAVDEADGPLFALPTYTALLELRTLLVRARPGEGVLAMSAARTPRRSGTTSSAAATPPTSRLGASSAARPTAPCSSSARGDRPRRASPRRRGHRGRRTRSRRASSLDDLDASARAAGLDVRDGARRRPRLRPRPRVRRCARADAAHPDARRPARSAARSWRRSPAHLRPGGTFAAALLARMLARTRRPRAPRRSRTCASSTAGSTRACRSRSPESTAALELRRLRQIVSPDGRAEPRSTDAIRLDALSPDRARGRGGLGRPRARASGSRSDPTDDHVGSIVVRPGGGRDGAARCWRSTRSR